MPGSKRRALKKLLSPNSTPSNDPSTSPSPQSTSNSNNTLSQMISPPQGGTLPPPAISLSPAEVEESIVLENMAAREKEIGHSTSPSGLTPSSITQDQDQYQGQSQTQGQVPASSPAPSPIPSSPSSAQNGNGSGNGSSNGIASIFGGGSNNGDGNGIGIGKKKKSSRQKFEERQARKQEALLHSAPPDDPNWTAQLEKERLEEIRVIGDACTALGRELYEISPDGHCMFSAIADQLAEIGIVAPQDAENYRVTRNAASKFMLSHPDEFMPFLPSITGEDSAGATDDGIMTEKDFKKYCQLVAETGEWGGEPEIQALSRAFNVPIHVIQSGPPTVVSHGGGDDAFGGSMTPEQSLTAGDKVVRISYHKRMYGLGEHYNSLRRV
ncbi:uncharacterized protein IL334_000359 [Kwoniella shivajii]|uniref:OTU domain-containing protein n=1 Tax=Kwoniella shivajii TaxID=564305 RepID=A0ABZ1CQE9_9TREE|nr:hypothetical protein IL334_000359 [Kwoniella shivajii]